MAPGLPAATGSLASRPLAHLLVYALDNELNGSLAFTMPDGSEAGRLLLRRGCPAKIWTTGGDVFLSGVLSELGYVEDEKLAVSLDEAMRQRTPHGQVLLAKGWVASEHLVLAVREQTQRKLAHLFALGSETLFAFHEGVDLLAEYGGGELVLTDPFPAIWRGVRELPPEDHVRALLARVAEVHLHVPATARIDRFAFGHDELALATSLRSREMRLADLVATRILPSRMVELLVYCLLITKQVEVAQAPPRSAPPPPPSTPRGATIPPTTASNSAFPAAQRVPAQQSVRAPAPAISSAQSIRAPAPHHAPPGVRPSLTPPRVGSMPPQPSARAKAIAERARTIRTEDYFQRLSVARDATPQTVEEAFQAIARLWDGAAHPPDLREACAVVHAALVEAHETLRDPDKRNGYMKKLALGLLHQPDPVDDLAESGADNDFDGAKACLEREDYDRAERLARKALKARPNDAATMALYAWIDAQRPANHGTEATRARILTLDKALRLDPVCEDALLYRAILNMRIENFSGAKKDLNALIQLNPDHPDAASQLRACQAGQRGGASKSAGKAKAGSGSGFFQRLLKK